MEVFLQRRCSTDHKIRGQAPGIKRSLLSFVEQKADVTLINVLTTCSMLFISAQFHRGQFLLLLHLGHQCFFHTRLCQIMVLRCSSYQSCPWRWALLCDFLCSVSQWQLAQGCVSLWDSLQDFWCSSFYTEDVKCASLLASHHQTVRASLRLQKSHKLVRQLS